MTTKFASGLSRESLVERLKAWLSHLPEQVRALNDVPGGICLGSWVGQREGNEDEVAFCAYASANSSNSFKVAVLCDGIGGMKEGAAAARIAVGSLIAELVAGGPGGSPNALDRAIRAANKTVYASLQGRGGCTLSAVLSSRGSIAIGSVGDSRVYGLAEAGIRQLTTDDTLAAYANKLGQKAVALPELHSLAQFIGMGSELEPKVEQLHESLVSIVLTSDGVHFIGESNLGLVGKHAANARSFVQRAMHLAEWLGGSDNASLASIPLTALRESAEGEVRRVLKLWSPRGSLEIWLVP